MPRRAWKRWWIAFGYLVAISAVYLLLHSGSHVSSTPRQSVPPASVPARIHGHPRRVALGVTINNAPSDLVLLESYERAAGAPPSIVMDFRGFTDPLLFPTEERNLRRIDATPMVTWDPSVNGVGLPLALVAAGGYDRYIEAQARLAKASGRVVYLRFGHEMNLPSSPWGSERNGNTPALYIAAWRHVVGLFRREHVTNVRWVWSPNTSCHGNCPFAAYYPGNPWVDYVALDGYNFAGAHGVPWVSFRDLFSSSYAQITAISDKPVMIAETAAPQAGGNKAAWIRQAFLYDIPRRFTRVVAVIWWDRIDDGEDWRVNSSAASLAVWRQVVASPLYRRSIP